MKKIKELLLGTAWAWAPIVASYIADAITKIIF